MNKNWTLFIICGVLWSFLELMIGLLFVYFPGLAQEYLYPHYAHISGELALIQMGWIYVGVGFGSVSLLYKSKPSMSTLASLRLVWSLPLFKEIWSIWHLVSWDSGWGSVWHSLQLASVAFIWFYSLYGYSPSSPCNSHLS